MCVFFCLYAFFFLLFFFFIFQFCYKTSSVELSLQMFAVARHVRNSILSIPAPVSAAASSRKKFTCTQWDLSFTHSTALTLNPVKKVGTASAAAGCTRWMQSAPAEEKYFWFHSLSFWRWWSSSCELCMQECVGVHLWWFFFSFIKCQWVMPAFVSQWKC